MNMRVLAALAGLVAMAGTHHSTTGSSRGESEAGGIPSNPKKVIPAGCKEYTFYGITVVALSEKRAMEKARKIRDRLYKGGQI